ncbi:uncharacterized protein HaLaN_30579, partial [Haematococcus lacustris]
DNTKASAAFIAAKQYLKAVSSLNGKTTYTVAVGDAVELSAEEGETSFVGRVTELFEDVAGTKLFSCHYWYQAEETVMQNKDQQVGIEAKQYDRRLWLATEQDNASYLTVHSLDVIARCTSPPPWLMHRLFSSALPQAPQFYH